MSKTCFALPTYKHNGSRASQSRETQLYFS